MPRVQALKEKYLTPDKPVSTRLIYLDGKNEFRPLTSVPNPSAAKEEVIRSG